MSNDKRLLLSKLAVEIAPQLVLLSSSTCLEILQQNQHETTALMTSLQLLKVIISKIPIGNHLNMDVLYMLLSIVEVSATSQDYLLASLNAVEILTEFMSKRFIPTGHSNGDKESVANTLVGLVTKAVHILSQYRYLYTASCLLP
jgi:predicted metal-dependent TIM-barrel fold hydrolase